MYVLVSLFVVQLGLSLSCVLFSFCAPSFVQGVGGDSGDLCVPLQPQPKLEPSACRAASQDTPLWSPLCPTSYPGYTPLYSLCHPGHILVLTQDTPLCPLWSPKNPIVRSPKSHPGNTLSLLFSPKIHHSALQTTKDTPLGIFTGKYMYVYPITLYQHSNCAWMDWHWHNFDHHCFVFRVDVYQVMVGHL